MTGYQIATDVEHVDDAKVVVVASRFNATIVDGLIGGCMEILQRAGLREEAIRLVRVPGAFEIPITVKRVLETVPCDAVITLGAVVRGETPHFEYIATACTRALSELSISESVPIIFGVLTVNSVAQAEARSRRDTGNKGAEAAQAALEMISVFRALSGSHG